MAFVYKEERKFEYNKVKTKAPLGPGEYLPQTNIKFLKVSQAPFSSQEEKMKTSINHFPGPGTYYRDNIETKVQQIMAKSELVSTIQADNVEQDNSIPFEMIQGKKYQIRPTVEKLGFDIKAKRFVEKEDDNPGPANYFKEQRHLTSGRNNSSKPPSIKVRLQSAKGQNIPSIPCKDSIGFDIGQDQQLIKHVNQEEYLYFQGEKGDTVGPGSYYIDNPNTWQKNGPQWSKMKQVRGTSALSSQTRPQTAYDNKQSMNNFYISTQKKSQKGITGRCNTARLLNSNRQKRKENFNNKINEEIKHKEHNLFYDNFKKITYDQIPGPGYYIDLNNQSSFQAIPYPETKQFFGSNEQRFGEIKGNAYLGPTTYFPTENNSCTIKKFKGKNNFVPFSTNAKRFDPLDEDNDKINLPGPGTYNPKILSIKENKNYNNNGVIFNNREKRFDEKHSQLKWQIDTPGPGAYIDPYSAKGTSNTVKWKGLYLDLRKVNELKRPQSSSFTKVTKKYQEMHPDVGSYNPDKIFSIEYNAKKNSSKKHSDDIAFSSCKSNKKESMKTNVGPGFYHRDKFAFPMQIYPPFHQSDQKLKSLNSLLIGPGQYDSTSYFDWNKKTYNASFL